jgi:hypothetical protein
MKTYLVKLVLSLLAGITEEQWKKALELVRSLFDSPKSGEEKHEATLLKLKSLWPQFRSWALNLLIEAAVAFVMKEKKVEPKTKVI